MYNIQIKKMLSICLLLVPFSLWGASTHQIHIDTSVAKDATQAVWKALQSARVQTNTTIDFAPGTYHFYPDKAFEKYLYISNHDDHLSRIAFPIHHLSGLVINGNGSRFIMHGVIIPFLVEESSDVILKNLTIDWSNPFHSQGVVTAVNEKARTFDISFSKDYPYEIRDGKIVFIKEYYTHDINQAIFFDSITRGPLFKTELMSPIQTQEKKAIRYCPDGTRIQYPYPIDKQETIFRDMGSSMRAPIQQLKPGVIRISKHKKQLPPVGAIFVCKGRQDFNRIAPAIFLLKTHDTILQDVTINHAGGMGILGQNSENISLDKVTITPSGNRIISTTADASHFVGCRGTIRLNHCLFENQLDDALNVHGTYQVVQDHLSDTVIGSRLGHFQQLGFTLAQAGDTIGFVRIDESFTPYAQAIVKKVTSINGRYQQIEFTKPLPQEIQLGDLMENLTAYPSLLVENSRFQHNRARGLLLSTPKQTIVRNCYFENEMDGILMPVENSKWFESGSACNVLIEHNTFKNCATLGTRRAVIRFSTDGDNPAVAFRNITIRDNLFDQYDNLIMSVTNVDGLHFEDNVIKTNDIYPALFPESPAIELEKSTHIYFKGNDYQGRASQVIEEINPDHSYQHFIQYTDTHK